MSCILGDLIEADASGFACSKSNIVESGLIHLRPFNIDLAGGIDLSTTYCVPESMAPANRRQLCAGDILFNNTNSADLVGKAAIVEEDMTAGFSNHLTRIRVRRDKVETRYFLFILLKLRSQGVFTAAATQWVSQAAYRVSDLKLIEISLPPLSEQRRIVDILDRAAAIQRLRRAAEDKAREIIPALFVDMFGDPATNPKGWPVAQLGDALLSGPQNGLYRPASAYGDGTRILRIDSFDDGCISAQSGLRRLRIDAASIEKFGLRAGDIVVNRVNSPPQLGKSVLIPALEEPTVFESNMMRMRLNPEIMVPVVLATMLQLGSVRMALTRNAKHAINQSSINQGDVTGVPIFAPPLSLQTAFAERAERLDAIARGFEAATATARLASDALMASFLAAA